MIDFQKVESDTETINILYFLLKKRNHKISHQNMPNFAVHENFVKHNPYKVWYLVNLDGKAIGSFYIKFDNSVGMNLNQETKYIVNSIIEFIKNNFEPANAKESLIPSYFYINVPFSNNKLLNILRELNKPPIQISVKI